MEQLIDLIGQKTGISQENAQKAAQTAIDFLTSKLPPALTGQVAAASLAIPAEWPHKPATCLKAS